MAFLVAVVLASRVAAVAEPYIPLLGVLLKEVVVVAQALIAVVALDSTFAASVHSPLEHCL